MGSRLRDQWASWTDASVFARTEQWKGLILAMVTPQEANLLCTRNILDEANKIKYNTRGLTLKDLIPDTFESNEKSQLPFRQWSDEFSSWVERIDKDFQVMLGLAAQMHEWNEDKFTATAQQDHCVEREKFVECEKHISL